MLLDPTTYSHDLPDTGLSPEMEKAVSATFIQTPNYGTRCSTFIRIHRNGTFLFEERTYRREAARQTAEPWWKEIPAKKNLKLFQPLTRLAPYVCKLSLP